MLHTIKPRLVSCRSHFNKAYLAYATVSEFAPGYGFGHDTVGFNTVFDGGSHYDPADNMMWHFFATLHEDGHQIDWVVVFQERVGRFQMSLPDTKDVTGWPSVSFEELWELLNEKMRGIDWYLVPSNRPVRKSILPDYITQREYNYSHAFQKNYFNSFGQGEKIFLSSCSFRF